jgi:hypothetical protein
MEESINTTFVINDYITVYLSDVYQNLELTMERYFKKTHFIFYYNCMKNIQTIHNHYIASDILIYVRICSIYKIKFISLSILNLLNDF